MPIELMPLLACGAAVLVGAAVHARRDWVTTSTYILFSEETVDAAVIVLPTGERLAVARVLVKNANEPAYRWVMADDGSRLLAGRFTDHAMRYIEGERSTEDRRRREQESARRELNEKPRVRDAALSMVRAESGRLTSAEVPS